MTEASANCYRFDRFVIDTRSISVRRDDIPVPLRPKTFDVLLYLVRNAGRLVAKDELFDKVWPNVIVTENSLVQCVKEIRQALGDDQQSIIETVSKRGYIFKAAVVESDASAAAATLVGPAERSAAIPTASPRPAFLRGRRGTIFAAGGVVTALGIAVGFWWALNGGSESLRPGEDINASRPAHGRLSIAVLPFEAVEKSADDYFSVGISEDIAAALGRFPDLAVASPKATLRFRSTGSSAEDIQRQLKVKYLVEGNIRRSPERMRIAIRLTDLPRGILLWSKDYDAGPATIIAMRDDMVSRIAGALSVKLTALEQRRAASKSSANMEAYDLVLRGRELMTRLSRTAHSEARQLFERALAMDSSYADAFVWLGRIDLSAVAMGWTGDPDAALKRAEDLAHKAIALDEFNPAAHVLLGRTYARMREYERAVDTLKRAIELNPSEPDSHAGLGDALLWSGDAAGAITALETATAMDPRLSAEDLFSLGAAYFLEGRSADTIRVLERTTNRREGNAFIYAVLAAAYAESGRDAEAQTAAAAVRKLNPFFDVDRFGSLFKDAKHRARLAAALKKSGL